MKEKLLILAIISFFGSTAFGQCPTVNQSVNATFGYQPNCWSFTGCGIHNSKLRVTSSITYGAPTFVLPKTINARGVLNFTANNTTNAQQGFGSVVIGAISDPNNLASFEPITTISVYPTVVSNQIVYKTYSADLSSYTGTHQYVAVKLLANSSYMKVINFISMDYESGCESTIVNAIAKNDTIQLDNTGNASIDTSNVNNGSNSDCDDLILSLNRMTFDCSDIGTNLVVLTASNGQTLTDTAHSIITVLPAINDENVTADETEICFLDSTNIVIGSSIAGITYSLIDSATNTVIDSPKIGTGSSLSFNTGLLNANHTYQVHGETRAPWTGLSFDGVNDKIMFSNDARGITSEVTVSAWVKTSFSGASNFISAKYDGVAGFALYINSTGNLVMDGRDNTGVYKSSGATDVIVNDGNWHYLSASINTNTGIWKLYVDGDLEKTTTHAVGTTLANENVLTVGYHSIYLFTGELDEFSIWNKELDQASINQHKGNCLTGAEDGIVALYKFNTAGAAGVKDLSSYNLTGTLYGVDASNWIPNDFSCGSVCEFTMTDLVHVSIITTVDVSTTVVNETITANQTGATYQWLDCNNGNAPIQGETNQDFYTSNNGSYSCEITYGCMVNTTDCINIISVGSEELDVNAITVYPNPTNGIVNLSGIDIQDINSIIVKDINGKTVLAANPSHQMNMRNLNTGMYFLQIHTNSGVLNKMISKK